MSRRRALIAGASGLVGSACLQALLERKEYESALAVGRRPVTADSPKLEQRTVDFEKLGDLPPVDDVFCALGTTLRAAGSREEFRRIDFGFTQALADAAQKAGAKRFVLVTSVATDTRSPNFYLRVKGQIEQDVALRGFEAVHILRPSFLAGRRHMPRLEDRTVIPFVRAFGFLFFGPMRIYRAIEAETVGRAMVGAALGSPETRTIQHADEIQFWADWLRIQPQPE